ncbi:MAG: leucyl aminopeptidase family protein [Desulfatibacillaceae bacterium]
MKITRGKTAGYDTEIRFYTKEESDAVQDFKGENKEVAIRYDKGKTLVCCGLGEKKDCRPHLVRKAAARGIRKAAELKRGKVSVVAPKVGVDEKACELAAVEGVVLGAYTFDRYKSEKPDKVQACQFVGMRASTLQTRRAQVVCESVNAARDLVNENASVATPEYLAGQAREIATGNVFKVTVLDRDRIDSEGLGLLKAVGQGSPFPPRLIVMEYMGAPRSKEKTAIVGKGITYDTGGLNLKPSGHIEDMRIDMAGAATVMGVMRALAQLGPAVNVVGVVAAAHNAIDGNSYIPGDIHTSYLGKTVEICNTDAEGRLVLADAIAYANEKYKPTAIIDLATLTGAVLVALASFVAGLFTTDEVLAEKLFEAGEDTRERLWRFPMYEEYCEKMKSDRADLRNLPKLPRGHAGSITGAAFIKEFAGETPWAHIDIAGTAYNEDSEDGDVPRYATGFGVRLLMRYLGVI